MGNMFISNERAFDLLNKYGSPLYVYDENTLRDRCKEMRNLLKGKNFKVNYSAKANSNLELLKIIESENIDVDAMSPGEMFVQKMAGFPAERIFYISNNVSADELRYAIDRGIMVSVDSLSQLRLYGEINPGGQVAVRFNPGAGVGHHEKVVTAGAKTKFGVQSNLIDDVKKIADEYDLKIVGINQHIGSLFLDEKQYIDCAKVLFEIAKQFNGLKFIDLGGGFGVPYKEQENRLDLSKVSERLHQIIDEFLNEYDNKEVIFKVEPGRYIVAECGMLLGEVYSVKENYGAKYVGTDLGFNVLARPVMYDSYHEIHVFKKNKDDNNTEKVNIVGNICESGDIIAKDRLLPKIVEEDIIGVMNTGAYGFAMSSNYNYRLKPAEVLITSDGKDKLIRRRDNFEDLVMNYHNLDI